jgi:hypothetical protein
MSNFERVTEAGLGFRRVAPRDLKPQEREVLD